jgi:penicillin-binding protein 1A
VQSIGADRVAQLAREMGVRDSKLEAVPSLALGTSPVTLKEMVSAYGTIANGGQYIAPSMVTRIEDHDGNVLAQFRLPSPQRALSASANETLVDVMRDVIDRGTGTSIRTRFGIRADVAGKTGTTQDNADGWFILMHPQLVAGAWVGFNDSRVTLRSDYWGQGAHSALPIVGDFYQRALRARIIDPRVRFAEVDEKSWYSAITDQVKGWYQRLFSSGKKEEAAPAPRPSPRRPVLPETESDALPPASAPATTADNSMALDPGEVVEAAPDSTSPTSPAPPTSPAAPASLPSGTAAPPALPQTPAPATADSTSPDATSATTR